MPSGPVVPTGVTEEDIKFEEEQAEQRRLEKIDTEIDYEAADAETDMPTPADMAREQMINLGLAIPEKIVDKTSRVYRAKQENKETSEAISARCCSRGHD